MPLNLLHGDAGSNKSEAIIAEIAALDHEDFMVVLPETARDQILKKVLLKIPERGLFWEQKVLSFEQFLTQCLKVNLPKVHRATSRFSRTLIRRILAENNFKHFPLDEDNEVLSAQISQTFINFKKAGLNPKRANMFFSPLSQEMLELMEVFQKYQAFLEEIHHFDDGDLTLKCLDLLRSNAFNDQRIAKHVYIDRLFPLTLGQQEILKELCAKTNLIIKIGYSFDYEAKDDPYFYPAYNFLGDLAERAEHLNFTRPDPIPNTLALRTPADECQWVVDQILMDVKQGHSVENIVIVVEPQSFYHERLSHLLKQFHIPFGPSFKPLVINFPELTSEQIKKIWTHFPQQSDTAPALLALQTQQTFQEEWSYETDIIFKNFENTNLIDEFKTTEMNLLQVEVPYTKSGVKLLPLNQSFCLDSQKIYFVGFHNKAYPHIPQHPSFIAEGLLLKPEMWEILNSPTYAYGLSENYFLQTMKRCTGDIYITYPQIQWNGQEVGLSPLLSKIKHTPTKVSSTISLPSKELPTKDYKPVRKWEYNITELETYLKCPYLYYARYVLKIDDLEDREHELPPKTKGQFIHQVLELIFKENRDLFKEALEYELYLKKLMENASKIIDDQIDLFFKEMDEELTKDFIHRSHATIRQFLMDEIQLIKEGKKSTFPHYFEWAFGKKTAVEPLKIHTPQGCIELSGRIDRIDIHEKKKIFTVVDYKTGNLDSGAQIKKGNAIQLPLYMMAVQKHLLPHFEPSAGLLVGLKDMSRKGIILSDKGEDKMLSKTYHVTPLQWSELKKTLEENIEKTVKNIHSGQFSPNPQEASLCRMCDYKSICHYNET